MPAIAIRLSLVLVVWGALSYVSASAEACPMCNQSIANEDTLPKAYMYSILFMLGMPATVFTGFGVFLHRKFSVYNAAQMALPPGDGRSPAEAYAPHSVTGAQG